MPRKKTIADYKFSLLPSKVHLTTNEVLDRDYLPRIESKRSGSAMNRHDDAYISSDTPVSYVVEHKLSKEDQELANLHDIATH